MKSLLIERVSNGWIVRPFTPSCDWARGDQTQMFVFTSIAELTNALPALLDNSPYRTPIASSQSNE